MPDVIDTKLSVPLRRRAVVDRPRLTDRLRRGTERRLTLVSAPPGFGKSTLIAAWIAGRPEGPVGIGWVSLDEGDNDAASFWSYVAAAFSRAASGMGGDLGLEPGGDVDLGALVNGLATVPGEIVLVLDDLHVVESPRIHEELATFLDRLPEHAHVVVATRADPPLPLARLRARGDLVEIRAADLRFTPDEAAAYLGGSTGLQLSAANVAALEARTEGWIAALQLAALSMEGRDDVVPFIESFAGDDRYVFDYLVDEVLARQSSAVRSFLVETAILDSLTGPLCDAVTGRSDGRAMLETLDRANLFLVALDDQRRWYRYHHLFADVLRARLRLDAPDLEPELHRRASAWFEAAGDQGDAIRHALAAGEPERAADLIEPLAYDMLRRRQEVTVRRWLDALPDELFDHRPVLAMVHVGALESTGTLERVEERLAAIEPWLPAVADPAGRAAADAAGLVVRDEAAFRHLPAASALHRAGLAQLRGETDAVIAHARRVLEVAPEDQPLERGGAAGLLGLAYWTRGDLVAAHAAWSEAIVDLERSGNVADVQGCSIALGDIRIAQGRLADARRDYDHALRLGSGQGTPPLRGTADMHTGLGELELELNDLAASRRHLDAAEELGEGLGLPQNPYRWRVAMARLRAAEGDAVAATALLDDAERRYVGDMFPEVRPVAAVRARLWIAQGRLADAHAWARERGLTAADDLDFMREYEHLTLVRLLLASARVERDGGAARQALELASRLHDDAERGGRGRSVIESLALQALARRELGERDDALRTLDRALALAEPEGFVRLFIDEGPPMAALVGDVARLAPSSTFAARVLVAFEGNGRRPAVTSSLAEPLSERELDVLRLLAGDLDGPDIARELFVSLNTLRTHSKHIYEKLGVTSRRAAVTRAVELGLLPGSAAR